LGVSAGYIAHLENGRTLPGRETLKALARALGVPETEMLKEAGFLSSVTSSDEELLDDPELRLFFREEWQELSEEEKEWFRGFIRMIKETRRQRKLQQT
jgi:transcriptional regulator with XRE-family HTH domain